MQKHGRKFTFLEVRTLSSPRLLLLDLKACGRSLLFTQAGTWFFAANWQEVVHKYISPDQMPQAYGGTRCEPDPWCTDYVSCSSSTLSLSLPPPFSFFSFKCESLPLSLSVKLFPLFLKSDSLLSLSQIWLAPLSLISQMCPLSLTDHSQHRWHPPGVLSD